jgi:hypothetical protein
MDTALLSTGITVIGSVIVALISSGTTLITLLIKKGTISPTSFWKWVKLLGYPLAALLIIGFGGWIFYLLYDGTASRLQKAVPEMANYNKRIYANVGLGFAYPKTWEVEDYGFRFGGGPIALVSLRETDGIHELQGIEFRIDSIAKHHWDDPESEYKHLEKALQKKCTHWSREAATVSNGAATVFKCTWANTEKNVEQKEWHYWYQLSQCVRLKATAWSSIQGPQRAKFEQEMTQVMQLVRMDEIKIAELKNAKKSRCEADGKEAALKSL